MGMKKLLLTLCLEFATEAFAQTVSIQGGIVIFHDNKTGQAMELTSGGRDSQAVLAPDGKWIAFVRKADGKKIATGSEEMDPTELWQVRIDGKEPSLLLKCRAAEKPESLIAAFETLQFST